ncbi:hypothetical protein KC19_2G170400 [Ceratodon purpureus]|uniref:Uncharacterized protein n=1 Tax=Ceratodon purpureus TaxID=3225 RepID=A0A8T0IXP5_CERPU|nr:hypothetical protein KC19_2G170400 [Ceratodon purpureus]
MSSSREIVPCGSQSRSGEKFALANWVSSEGDGSIRLASEVVQSCERIIIDARPDVLYTLRFVAFIAIVGFCLVQIEPHSAFLLSRILVDLPLGILSDLCGLVAPPLDLVFVQLPLAIGHGVLGVVTPLFSGVGWVIFDILDVITSLLSGVLWALLGIVYVITSVLSGVLWVISSVLYVIKYCVTLPLGFL